MSLIGIVSLTNILNYMREVFSKLYGAFLRLCQKNQWKREARKERNNVQQDNTLKQEFNGRCLILIPHSDDEWIGCSKIIQSDNEVILCNMNMGGNDTDLLHKERLREMIDVAKHFNRKFITIKDNKRESLCNTIKEVRPDFIFLPHFIDWHPEHIEVMKLLSSAVDFLDKTVIHFKVATYQVSCPILSGITYALPMSKKEWKYKWDFFKRHYPTQLQIPFQRFSLNETISGVYVGAFAAEVFCVYSVDEWQTQLRKRVPSVEQMDNLKNNLGSITSVRGVIRKELTGE